MARDVTALDHGEPVQTRQLYLCCGLSTSPVTYTSEYSPVLAIKLHLNCLLLPLRLKRTSNWPCGMDFRYSDGWPLCQPQTYGVAGSEVRDKGILLRGDAREVEHRECL